MKTAGVVLVCEVVDHEDCGDELGDDGCVRNALDAHAEDQDKTKVQAHIDGARDREIGEGASRVADGAKDGASEVVKHHDRHAEEVDAHIVGRAADDVRRSVHQGEERAGVGKADGGQKGAAYDAHKNCRVHGFFHVLFAVRSGVARNQNVGAHGEP